MAKHTFESELRAARRVLEVLGSGILWSVLACSVSVSTEHLAPSVRGYNQSLRWKRFDRAAAFLPVKQRSAFLARYAAAEGDLHIDDIEVRDIQLLLDEQPPAAEVLVVAHTYLLPSTVLTRTIQRQRWELEDDTWLLVSQDRSLLKAKPSPESVQGKGAIDVPSSER